MGGIVKLGFGGLRCKRIVTGEIATCDSSIESQLLICGTRVKGSLGVGVQEIGIQRIGVLDLKKFLHLGFAIREISK